MMKPYEPLSPHPLCAQRMPSKAKKKRHLVEDFMAYRAGLDPKVFDALERCRGTASRLNVLFDNEIEADTGTSVAIYAHHNASSRVSKLVLRQLELIKEQGFHIYFASMSKISDQSDLEALRKIVKTAYERRSFGRDFGAWHDVWKTHSVRFSLASEVLLLNDSVLGPIFPIDPIFFAMRNGQDGLYGLTDSPDTIPHLQSYFLFLRGAESINALDDFFAHIKLSYRKNTMVRRGEIGLAQHMARSRIRSFCLFPFEKLEAHVTSDISKAETVLSVYPELALTAFDHLALNDSAVTERLILKRMRHVLLGRALNPTHYFWRPLVETFGFPFFKTELLKVNPVGMPDLEDWDSLIPQETPVTAQDIRDHLDSM